MQKIQQQSQTLQQIPLTKINPNRANRKTKQDMVEFIQELQSRGMINPITVAPVYSNKHTTFVGIDAMAFEGKRGFFYQLIDGERRYEAHKAMKETKIASMVKLDNYTKLELYEMMAAANAQRLDMTPMDMANAIKQYIDEFIKVAMSELQPDATGDRDFFESQAIKRYAQVAKFSESHIKSRYDLLNAPRGLQNRIEQGTAAPNVYTEIVSSIPDELGFRKYALDKATRDVKHKTLAPRPAGRKIKAILKRMKAGKVSQPDAIIMGNALIDGDGLDRYNKNVDTLGDFGKYLAHIEELETHMETWTLTGLSDKEVYKLARAINGLKEIFENMQTQHWKIKTTKGLKIRHSAIKQELKAKGDN